MELFIFILKLLAKSFFLCSALIVAADIVKKVWRCITSKFLKMGRFSSRKLWHRAVANYAVRMLEAGPLYNVFHLRDSRYVLLSAYRALRMKQPHKGFNSWNRFVLIRALKDCGCNLSKLGQMCCRVNLNSLEDGFMLYNLWSCGLVNDERMEKMGLEYLKLLRDDYLTGDGLVSYTKTKWMYLADTLPFLCPFLIKFGVRYNQDDLIGLAMKQMRAFYEHAYVKGSRLYAHGYRVADGGLYESLGWGRGTGWVLLAYALAFRELPDGDDREWVRARLREGISDVVQFQRQDGGWGTRLVQGCPYDSSATAIFTLVMLMMRNEFESGDMEMIQNSVNVALEKLRMSTASNGALMCAEGECKGVGNYSTEYSAFPFAQGMLLWCLNLENKSRC